MHCGLNSYLKKTTGCIICGGQAEDVGVASLLSIEQNMSKRDGFKEFYTFWEK